jgi:hypothetical protein
VNLAVGAVAAALVAAVAVLAFLLVRTLGSLRALKAGLTEFRTEAEPLAREVATMAERAAARAGALSDGPSAGRDRARRR